MHICGARSPGPAPLLARRRGDPNAAWAQIHPRLPRGPATDPGDICHQEGLLLQRLAAGLCLEADDLPVARNWLEAHDRWLAWSEGVLGAAEAQLAWARWHRAAGDVDRACAAATEALELASAPEQPLVQWGAHLILGELATVDGNHAVAEEHLTTALALAAACEAPFERALTLLALAELHVATGSAEVNALLDEVRGICVPLGAAPLLARADALTGRSSSKQPWPENPAGLTEREVEVLRLIAKHYTDKEIAEALFISPHTASTHVKHVLAKLGVSRRRDAASHAAELGLV